jgi:hypothetical protein
MRTRVLRRPIVFLRVRYSICVRYSILILLITTIRCIIFRLAYWTVLQCRLCLKCDGTRAETRFRLSAKRTSPFKSAGTSVQSTTGSRGVRISGSNAGYTMFRGSVKSTGYLIHSPVSPSLPLPCVTVCHHISTGLYLYCLSCHNDVCLTIAWTCGCYYNSFS